MVQKKGTGNGRLPRPALRHDFQEGSLESFHLSKQLGCAPNTAINRKAPLPHAEKLVDE